jgi:WD40 repeat protein
MLTQLSEYITQIAWSPTGETLAVASAAGEVVLLNTATGEMQAQLLDDRQNQSIDALGFSADGQFLAVGGQSGKLSIWSMDPFHTLILSQDCGKWIEHLVWHPTLPLIAFSFGKHVQIWDARSQTLETTFNFEASSIWALTWHPKGHCLAISGYQGTKIWPLQDWDEDPDRLEVASASVAIAWSPEGNYVATGNLDKTITLWEWENPHPWVMRGFPGKVQQLAWHPCIQSNQAHLLASISMEGIIIWDKLADEDAGWSGSVLGTHDRPITAIAWHPELSYLASASEDGLVKIWFVNGVEHDEPIVKLPGADQGFTAVCWHPTSNQLAAGGRGGEVFVWNVD